MAKRITKQRLEELRRECHREVDEGFDQMFGNDGQNGLVTFTEREERACQVGDRLSCWLLETHISLDQAVETPGECDCPLCGREVPGPTAEEQNKPPELQGRRVRSRRGPIDLERAARRCNPCRRVFFPLG